ncbi:UNVERIFIED_CONTAM: Tryptophan aminotransferase-related protein 1, partial [Sesamum radiatum]
WAFVKDEDVCQKMQNYIEEAELGISREAQLRALKLMKTILHADGREIFEYAHKKMSDRWRKLSDIHYKKNNAIATDFLQQKFLWHICHGLCHDFATNFQKLSFSWQNNNEMLQWTFRCKRPLQ